MIEKNVAARHACNAIMELGLQVARDEQLDPESIRLMWKRVIETATEFIGGVEDDADQLPPLSQVQTLSPSFYDDDDEFPFGKYEGKAFRVIPENYWAWLSRQDWVEHRWPHVHNYMVENELD